MSKSRRLRALNRKMESLRCSADELVAHGKLLTNSYVKSPLDLERERILTERLKSIFTPEYQQEMQEHVAYMTQMGQQMRSLTARLQHQLEQHRPSYGLGSYRTKRLRKKMYSCRERELQARGL